MILKDKVIFLLSPEKWGDIYLSKHNYANALAERGNKVYFFNPIDETLPLGRLVVGNTGIESISQVSFNPPFPVFLKFKLPGLFFWLLNTWIRRFEKKLGVRPDVIWDFTTYPMYSDLRKFGAQLRILHPVDSTPTEHIAHRNAHIAFSVSPGILEMIDKPDLPKYFINHGLSSLFTQLHKKGSVEKESEAINIGYVGNLLIHSLDYELFYKILSQNPTVSFHLIGPYEANSQLDSEDTGEAGDFIKKVKALQNVRLYGSKNSSEIAALIADFDAFIICYKMTDFYRCDNSHKVLEYLSTGKVVITNPITTYIDSDLIVTNKDNTQEGFLKIFSEVIANLDLYNASALSAKRIKFALDHSYQRNIDRIENYILESVIK